MNIVVCIKQVPNTNEVKLDPVTGTLIRDGVPSIINPDDKAGLEAALRLKDQFGAHVTVITMGPPQAPAAWNCLYCILFPTKSQNDIVSIYEILISPFRFF